MIPGDAIVVKLSEDIECSARHMDVSVQIGNRTVTKGSEELAVVCRGDTLELAMPDTSFPQEASIVVVRLESIRDLAGNSLEHAVEFSVAAGGGGGGAAPVDQIQAAAGANHLAEVRRLKALLNSSRTEKARLEAQIARLEDLVDQQATVPPSTASTTSQPTATTTESSAASAGLALDLQVVVATLSELKESMAALERSQENNDNTTEAVKEMLAAHMETSGSSRTSVDPPASRSTSSSSNSGSDNNSSLAYALYASMGITVVGFVALVLLIMKVKKTKREQVVAVSPATSGGGSRNVVTYQNPVYTDSSSGTLRSRNFGMPREDSQGYVVPLAAAAYDEIPGGGQPASDDEGADGFYADGNEDYLQLAGSNAFDL
jgi:hypothetical protein